VRAVCAARRACEDGALEMKRIAYAEHDRLIIVAFGAGTPDPDDWRGYMDFLRQTLDPHRQRALIMPASSKLEAEQRRQLDAVTGPHAGRDRRLAVVTESTFARGFAKALSLFDPSYRAFHPREMDDALRYLDVSPAACGEVKRLAADLQRQVGGSG
jgi:hypothetical protein